jgi:hypothetical protein
MIEELMKAIGEIECGQIVLEPPIPIHLTSFYPYPKPGLPRQANTKRNKLEDDSWVSDFLPCHYFGLYSLAFLKFLANGINRLHSWN